MSSRSDFGGSILGFGGSIVFGPFGGGNCFCLSVCAPQNTRPTASRISTDLRALRRVSNNAGDFHRKRSEAVEARSRLVNLALELIEPGDQLLAFPVLDLKLAEYVEHLVRWWWILRFALSSNRTE